MPCVIFLDQVLMSLGFHTDEFVQFFFWGGGLVLWRSSLKNFLVNSRYFFLSLDSRSPQFLPHPTARRFWATTALLVRSGAHSHLLVDSSLRIFRWYFHGMSSSCPHSGITYTKRNMLLEPMGLKQDTLFWILALCKNIFGYHRMLGLLARLFINSFVMPNLFFTSWECCILLFSSFFRAEGSEESGVQGPIARCIWGLGIPLRKAQEDGLCSKGKPRFRWFKSALALQQSSSSAMWSIRCRNGKYNLPLHPTQWRATLRGQMLRWSTTKIQHFTLWPSWCVGWKHRMSTLRWPHRWSCFVCPNPLA